MEFNTLENILQNLKKAPNRTYSTDYIQKTNKQIDELWLQITKIAELKDIQNLKDRFDNLVKQIQTFLKTKEEEQEINNEMANFDLVTATKVIPEFQGDHKDLNNYLGLIDFYHSTLKDDAQKEILIKFILATKLSENVKNKIQTERTPKGFDDFKNVLKPVFKSHKTASRLHSDIAKCYQGNQTVSIFASRIETLLASLNELQISEQGLEHREVIVKLNDQIGMTAFKNGLSEPYKSLVTAARPMKLAEAVQIALEIDPGRSNQIMYFNRVQRGRNNYNRNFNNFSNYNNSNQNKNRNFNQNWGRNDNRGQWNKNRPNSQGNGYVPGQQTPGLMSRRR